LEELQEFLPCSNGEERGRVRDDIRVLALAPVIGSKVKSESKAVRVAVRVGIGRPVELENRTVTGVEGSWKCLAAESAAASADGLNRPVSSRPLAWAGRNPGCGPKILCRDLFGGIDDLGIFRQRHD
jgi:hypothetical protein